MTLLTVNTGYSIEKPKEIHKRANILREKDKPLEFLNLYNQAILVFQKTNDYHSVLSVLYGRLISWLHLFNHEDKIYAIFARKEAETMLKEYNIHDSDQLTLEKSSIFLKDFKSAETAFKKTIHLYPYDNAEKGDWLAHLGEAVYQNSSKAESVSIILKSVKHIKSHSKVTDSFKNSVWTSGAYLRTCLKSMIRILCCYKCAINSQKFFGIFNNIAKNFCEFMPHLIIRSKILNRLLD